MDGFGMGRQNAMMMFGGVTSLAPLGTGITGMGFPQGMGAPGIGGMSMADMRCGQGMMGANMMQGTDMLGQMLMQQQQIMMMMMQLLLALLQGQARNLGNLGGGLGNLGGIGGGGGFGGGGGTGAYGGGGGTRAAGGAGGAAGAGPVTDAGPVNPGVDGLLSHANRMVGMEENRDRAAIQQVTGKSGINPASTPWCAAWAMNMLEMHGIMKLDGLSNRNYCPTIKSWAQNKGTWQGRGYTPKAGDAILFDWEGDGTADHIGIVEKVVNGKVYTIEGNSSDKVSKRSYSVGQGNIAGYVKS